MKSQNQISLKILTLALLFLASCEVWAVLGNQIQIVETNSYLFDRIQYPQDYYKILDLDYKYKPLYYDLSNQSEKIFVLDVSVYGPRGSIYCVYYTRSCWGGGVYNHSSIYCEECYQRAFPKISSKTNLKDKFPNELLKVNNQIVSNGTGGGDWNSTSSWVGGKIPQSGDEVIVAKGDKLIINSDVYVNSLVLKTNAVVRSDSWARRIIINKDLQVSDSASILSNFGSGKLDCYITAANDGKSLISIAQTAKVNFENLKILGETFFEKGNMDVMNFSAIKQKDFIAKNGTVLNIGQKK